MMKRKEIIAGNEISEIATVNLNGYEQKILIEGKKKENPIVITLHGGPGTPIPFSVGCRGMFPDFTDKFVMVYWDQLGCGINNCEINDSFSIDVFVKMTEDLVLYIRKRFSDNKIILFATSWGSILSAKLLEKNPHVVDAVIVAGQIIKNVFICDEVLNCLEQSNTPRKKLDRLKVVTLDNYSEKDLQLFNTCLNKYTDAYQNKKGTKVPMGKMIKGLFTSPDYSFRDFKAVMINGYMKNNSLWKEILQLDLTNVLSKVQVPYVFLQGDTDIVASTKTVEEIVRTSDNEKLSLYIVENTGHMPGTLMMEKLMAILVETAKQLK